MGRGIFLNINSTSLIPVHPYNIEREREREKEIMGNCVVSVRLVGAK